MKPRTGLFLSLLLGVALVHSGVLAGDFVWDDRQMVIENPELRDLENIPAMFGRNYFGERANVELYRPLVNVTLAIDYHLWGGAGPDGEGVSPFGFHLTNLLLHLSVGLLLYTVLRRLSASPFLPEAASLIFLLHPASAEPTAWIVGRGDLLAALLGLAVLKLHLAGRRRPALHGLALLFYLAALFGKLAAAPVPLLIFLVEHCLFGVKVRDMFRAKNLVRYALYLIPIFVYVAARTSALDTITPADVGRAWKQPNELAAIIVGLAVVARMMLMLVLPVGMCADYSADPVFQSGRLVELAEGTGMMAAAAAVLIVLIAAIWLRRLHPWAFFGVLWALAALLPVSQVVRIGAVMADRFLYIPSIGAAMGIAGLLSLLPRYRLPILLALLAAFIPLTISREAVWRDDGTMNEDVVGTLEPPRDGPYPGNVNAWNRLALHYGRRGDTAFELQVLGEVARRAPGNRDVLKNFGAALIEHREFSSAEGVLRKAFTFEQPRDLLKAKIAYNLGVALINQHKRAAAAVVLEEAVQCRPELALAFRRLGRLYKEDLDRPERGEELLRKALEIEARAANAGRPAK